MTRKLPQSQITDDPWHYEEEKPVQRQKKKKKKKNSMQIKQSKATNPSSKINRTK